MEDVIEWLKTTTALLTALTALLGGITALVQTIRPLLKTSLKAQASSVIPKRRRVWPLLFGFILVALGTGILVSRSVIAENLPLNARLTKEAWDAFNKEKWSAAVSKAEECIAEFRGQADREQEKLQKNGTENPPTGAVPEGERKTILSRGLLNDVATCFFIKGRALEKLGRKEEARQAFQTAAKYTYARCWDPSGWFWSPAEAAADRLSQTK